MDDPPRIEGNQTWEACRYGRPQNPPDSWTRNNLLGVAEVDVVVMGVEEDLVTDAVKKDGKEMYPCREVESEW